MTAPPILVRPRDGLFSVGPFSAEPAWLDYNSHVNNAYYLMPFEGALHAVFTLLQIGQTYREQTGRSFYTTTSLIEYRREMSGQAVFRIECYVGALARRSVTFRMKMIGTSADAPVYATLETTLAHVEVGAGRTVDIEDATAAKLLGLALTADPNEETRR